MSSEQSGGIASDIREKVSETATHIADRVRETGAQAEQLFHDRPGQSLLVAFAAGAGVGLGLALLFTRRSSSAPAAVPHSMLRYFEQCGHSIASAVRNALPDSLTRHSS